MSSQSHQSYSPALPDGYTYNRQKDLESFKFTDKIRQDRQKIVLKADPEQIDNDDLLVTNNLDASFTNENTLATLPNNRRETRYYQENIVYLNISSRQRQRFEERPVVASDRSLFPNKEIWDQFFDPESNTFQDLDICCLTFNNLLEFGQEYPYFFQNENQLFIRVPKDPNPNSYSITLQPQLRHIRAIRLVTVEGPVFLNQVNELNNLILLDVIDPCTNESFPNTDDLPFEIILIPIGSYTVESLMETMIKIFNYKMKEKIKGSNHAERAEECQPFSYFYDLNTGQIDIICQFQFLIKFWFSTTDPQFHLWEMLGYEFPYPRDEQNQPTYTNNFSNLVKKESPLILDQFNLIPFRRPNLDILDYVYLSIRRLKVIQDNSVTIGVDPDIYAKVLVRERRFVSSTKIFQVPLDRLDKIEVQWLDPFGNLLDLNGVENSFLLEIIEYQDKLKDTDFSSQRGLRNYDTEVDRVQYKTIVSIT